MGAGVAGACVLAWLAVLSVYDIRERRLPNWLTMPGAAVILAVAAAAGRGVPALLGAVALAGLYLVVHLLAPAAMGAGDVKLAAGLGGADGCVRLRRVGAGRTCRSADDRGVGRASRDPPIGIDCAAWPLDVLGGRNCRAHGLGIAICGVEPRSAQLGLHKSGQ